MNRSLSRGFTLIEMLVVLAIVALLLTMAVPRYFSSLEHSREMVLKENLKVVRATLDKFYADTGRFPDSLDELVQRGYLREVPADPITESKASWVLLPPREAEKTGIADLKSGAPGNAKDGRAYAAY